MIIREIGASLRALFSRLSSKTTTIAGTETVYLDDAGISVKAAISDVIRYGGGATRNVTAGNATITKTTDGTLYLEVAGQTAGNARGAGAFDWQAVRNVATRVASGANSVAIGQNNTASGAQSIAIGSGNLASGLRSGVFGFGNTSSGSGSFTLGSTNTASGTNSIALGNLTLSANAAQFSVGQAPALGQAQNSLQTFYTSTTDASATILNITGTATDRMVIPATRSVAFTGIVQAMCNVSASSNFIKAWKIEGVITRDGSNNTRIVGTPIITVLAQDSDGTQTPSTWAITSITADDTNESLAINVIGQTGQTIRWQASLFYSQVGF